MNITKITKEQEDFLKVYGEVVELNGEIYYSLPFLFRKYQDGYYEMMSIFTIHEIERNCREAQAKNTETT